MLSRVLGHAQGLIQLCRDPHVTLAADTRAGLELCQGRPGLDIRKAFFRQWAVRHWNRLWGSHRLREILTEYCQLEGALTDHQVQLLDQGLNPQPWWGQHQLSPSALEVPKKPSGPEAMV